MVIFNTSIIVMISFLVIITPIGVISSVILAIIASNEQNLVKKKKVNKWAMYSVAWPFVLLFLTLSLWGFVRILANTIQG